MVEEEDNEASGTSVYKDISAYKARDSLDENPDFLLRADHEVLVDRSRPSKVDEPNLAKALTNQDIQPVQPSILVNSPNDLSASSSNKEVKVYDFNDQEHIGNNSISTGSLAQFSQ